MLVKHYLTIYLLGFVFTLAPLALMLSASVMGNASTNTESWIVFGSWTIAVVLVVVGVYLFIKNIIRKIKLLLV